MREVLRVVGALRGLVARLIGGGLLLLESSDLAPASKATCRDSAKLSTGMMFPPRLMLPSITICCWIGLVKARVARRLAAVKARGWRDVPVRVVRALAAQIMADQGSQIRVGEARKSPSTIWRAITIPSREACTRSKFLERSAAEASQVLQDVRDLLVGGVVPGDRRHEADALADDAGQLLKVLGEREESGPLARTVGIGPVARLALRSGKGGPPRIDR